MNIVMDPATHMGIAICLLLWAAGVVSNVGRRMQKQGIGFRQYWMTDWSYSVAATFVSIAGVIYLLSVKETSPFMYFSVGYIADSFINRAQTGADAGTLDLTPSQQPQPQPDQPKDVQP